MMKTEDEHAKHFGLELDKVINRFREEYDLSYAAAIGALYYRAHRLANELEERPDEK